MGKIKLKRGIFFTLIAIVIMALLIIILTPKADVSLQKDAQAIRKRIDSVDNYVATLEDSYFKTALEATTFKTILSLALYINKTEAFLNNFDNAFYEVIVNGTINKVPIDLTTKAKIMDNNSLMNWSNRIIKTANSTYHVNTTIVFINVSVNQTDPWTLTTRLTLNITVKSNVAEWRRNKTIIATTSIEGLYDPYYLINTEGLYDKQIRKSDIQFDEWNLTHVRTALKNATYVHWKNSKAPSYLMRFVNNLEASECCGIESFVDPNKIMPNDIDHIDQRESYLDYLFWSHVYNPIEECTKLYNITNPLTGDGLWDEFKYFKLDIYNVILYNITSEYAVRNC